MLLKVENLYREYERNNKVKFNAVDNISFSLEKGTITGITGPSGSGKSTLFHLLTVLAIDRSILVISKFITDWEAPIALKKSPIFSADFKYTIYLFLRLMILAFNSYLFINPAINSA